MKHLIFVEILGNVMVAFIYAGIVKKVKQSDFLPRFLIIAFIPVFGLIILGMVDIMLKNKVAYTNELIFEEECKSEASAYTACSLQIEEIQDNMPIDDMLSVNDAIHRREMLFKAVNGDYRRLYPLLTKMLKDQDAEVVHYASTAIANYMQRINENFKLSEEKYLSNHYHYINQLQNVDDLIDLIRWEELGGNDISEGRRTLENELEFIFNSKEAVEEKYYIEKYRNEISVNEFEAALRTCNRYSNDFPESENCYMARLEFWYCRKDLKMFKAALDALINSGLVLSRDTIDKISFWRMNTEG